MIKLKEQYLKKDAISNALIKEAFEFKNKLSPYVIYDANYWLFGDLPEDIPDDYCGKDPSIMFKQQIKKIKRHYQYYMDDCYIGFLMPWFGTGVLASAFGTGISFNPKMDPAALMSTIKDPHEIETLKIPDPAKDGLMPRVLNQIKYFKENCDLPVGITDCQGPLTTTLSIIGYENFIYWMVDYPSLIHKFMDMVTDALINWVKIQKECIGEKIETSGYIIGAKIPEGQGGVWIADDDSVIIGSGQYQEFVKPYNEKILAAFGGGGIHYCGCSTQHIQDFINTKGLTCLHNLHQDDYESVVETAKSMQEAGKVFYICDYVPSDNRVEPYFDELFKNIDQKGLIVVSYIASSVALIKGKYELKRREQLELGLLVKQVIEDKRVLYSHSY